MPQIPYQYVRTQDGRRIVSSPVIGGSGHREGFVASPRAREWVGDDVEVQEDSEEEVDEDDDDGEDDDDEDEGIKEEERARHDRGILGRNSGRTGGGKGGKRR